MVITSVELPVATITSPEVRRSFGSLADSLMETSLKPADLWPTMGWVIAWRASSGTYVGPGRKNLMGSVIRNLSCRGTWRGPLKMPHCGKKGVGWQGGLENSGGWITAELVNSGVRAGGT